MAADNSSEVGGEWPAGSIQFIKVCEIHSSHGILFACSRTRRKGRCDFSTSSLEPSSSEYVWTFPSFLNLRFSAASARSDIAAFGKMNIVVPPPNGMVYCSLTSHSTIGHLGDGATATL